MDAAAKRRSEIDAKKAKLAELRKLREARQSSLLPTKSDAEVIPPSLSSSRIGDRQEIDDLVNSLVGEGLAARKSTRSEISTSRNGVSVVTQTDREDDFHSPLAAERQLDNVNKPEDGVRENIDKIQANEKKKDSFSAEAIPPTPAPVREVITYSKSTQTAYEESLLSSDEDEAESIETQEALIARLRREIEAELRIERAESNEKLDPVIIVKESTDQSNPVDNTIHTPSSVVIDNEQVQQTDQDSIVQKVSNGLPDYTRDAEIEVEDSKDGSLQQVVQFFTEDTLHRMITSLSWSPKFPELVLASYSKDPRAGHGSHGLIHIWNIKMTTRPEFTLFCPGEVQQAIFSPYHANIIIGGSYSGQIMIWDMKTKNYPFLTTPLTGRGHTYPITGLHTIGTKQSNSIVSASSDGTICIWSTDILAQPQESFELTLLPPSKVEEVTPTAVSHSATDSSTFLVGTEDGNMYSVNRQDRAGAKAGIDPKVVYKGHDAMITGVDHHRCKGLLDFSDLVLTASLDWTVKLWRAKPQVSMATSASGVNGVAVQKHLLEFQLDDMVYDVRWSPTRPGVFASVDGAGQCQLFDLCHNLETPLATGRPLQRHDGTGTNNTAASLNKVVWDSEGRRLAVGGLDGLVTVFEVPASVSGKEAATSEQWYQLNHKLKVAAKR